MRFHDRLAVLAAPVRTRILRLLEVEELGVGELAKVVQLPQSTVSRHVKELREGGWIATRKEGTTNLLSLAPLEDAAEALWRLARSETDGDDPDDALRLASVLAAREGDGRRFFGRVVGQWSQLRKDMFGETFLTPTLLSLLPSDHVVADLGCGTGESMALLAPAVGRVIGIDREPAMLVAAKARLEGLDNIVLREGELPEPPLEEAEVDTALCMLALHHVEQPADLWRAAARFLRPGGRLILLDMVAHDRTAYRRSMGHLHLGFGEADVRAWASAAGMQTRTWRVLPPAAEATGPALFLAVFARDT